VFIQKNFLVDLLQVKCIFDRKRPFCILYPILEDFGATYVLILDSLESS